MSALASETGPAWSKGRLTSYVFGLIFLLAALTTATAVWLASSAPGSGVEVGQTLRTIYTVLIANFLLIVILAAMIGVRVWPLLLLRAGDAGAKLHLRYMTLFALAAAVPAVVVALFFGLLVNQGIESWFSTRIRTVVENHAAVARLLVQTQTDRLNQEIAPTAGDLNRYASELPNQPEAYNAMLAELAELRGFAALYVINRDGIVLAEAERPGAPLYSPPSDDAFAEADEGVAASRLSRQEDLVRILFRLTASPDMYAVVAAPMPEGMLERLFESEQAVVAYREAEANSGRVQRVFVISYAETAMLVLLGAVWLGMAAASSISEPVARLVKAANKVASGDLSVRVDAARRAPEEIQILSQSFNRMTDDLKEQQAALVAAGADAENRRLFIETVLSGVSAGVIGLDPSGRISASNLQALRLLHLTEDVRGLPLFEVAPEFAEVVERARSEREDAESEIDLVRGSDTRRLRVRAGGNADDGLVLTFDDITRLVDAQRNAAWKDVARRIAHEIKNPLTPIQLSAERLRRKYRKEITSDLETFDRCTDTIVRQVEDIGRMVDEFSAFARMPTPRYTACDPTELLREAVFARRVADADISFELEEGQTSGVVVCDSRMIAQALVNVLKNAGEAVAARTAKAPIPPGRIVARLRQDEDMIIYEVEDNGVGLPTKDRNRLTEPYVTTREKGTGLGLAIVRRILEDHGGALILRDAPSGGARVIMQFPRGDAPAKTPPLSARP